MAVLSYKTLQNTAADEYIINKSRFIGSASPCTSEEEALAFIRSVRDKYRDATHNCYAYIIGQNAGIMRYSDDGEPGGTAGMPMIEVLKKSSLVDCCVVVTRYFGGILLGAGGLVRAYTKATVMAVNASVPVIMHESDRFLFDIPYPLWDRFSYAIKSLPVICEDTAYADTVQTVLLIKSTDSDTVTRKLTQLTDGKAEFLITDTLFYPWPVTNKLSGDE